jgi:hypothetical protein
MRLPVKKFGGERVVSQPIQERPGLQPILQEPLKDPARLEWHEVTKIQHYWLEVNAMPLPIKLSQEHAQLKKENR